MWPRRSLLATSSSIKMGSSRMMLAPSCLNSSTRRGLTATFRNGGLATRTARMRHYLSQSHGVSSDFKTAPRKPEVLSVSPMMVSRRAFHVGASSSRRIWMSSSTAAATSRIQRQHYSTTRTWRCLPHVFNCKKNVRGLQNWCTSKRCLSTSSSSTNTNKKQQDDLVQEYLQKPPTKYSLQQLMRTGQEEQAATTPKKKMQQPDESAATKCKNSSLLQFQKQKPLLNTGRLGQRLVAERILMQYASMLQHELPIRLAHRIHDLDCIPGMKDMPSVKDVKALYTESLKAIVNMPKPTDRKAEQQFALLLDELYRKHATVLLQMAKGAQEFRNALQQGAIVDDCDDENSNQHQWSFSQHDQCQVFLDRFYTSRVGIRVLAGQYLALREQLLGRSILNNQEDYVGMICKRTSPYKVVQTAIQDATRLCQEEYGGVSPQVKINGRLDLTFCYIPTHLHYIMMELLKNAMRATMDFHIKQCNEQQEENDAVAKGNVQDSFDEPVLQSPLSRYQQAVAAAAHDKRSATMVVPNVDKIPAVDVIIADSPNNEDVIIKIMDEGGGIPRSKLNQIFSYLYTTAENSVQERVLLQAAQPAATANENSDKTDVASAAAALSKSPILAGLGFGLPMSRAYARYFGGDLDIISLEGYGTDAYVYLRRLEETDSRPNEI